MSDAPTAPVTTPEQSPPPAPKHMPWSFADTARRFAFEIAAITAGILIALSFDAIGERNRERRLVEDARAAITRELADNRVQLDAARPTDGPEDAAWHNPLGVRQKAISHVSLAMTERSTRSPVVSSRRSLYTKKKSLSGRWMTLNRAFELHWRVSVLY